MVRFKESLYKKNSDYGKNLHSSMVRFKVKFGIQSVSVLGTFTFQYGSI